MLSIIIPAYNEAEIIEASLRRLTEYLQSRLESYEIIVVDNGSTDETPTILKRIESRGGELVFSSIQGRGAGRAFIEGVKKARGEYVLTLDADLSSDLVFIDYAVNLLSYADMVVGSKTMGNQRRTFLRVLGSQMYIMVTQMLFDLTISDYSIGCKAFRRESILDALDRLDHWTGYIFELCLYLKIRGGKIVQVGIDCDDQRRSHFNLLHEGVYRYTHLIKCYFRHRSKSASFVHSQKVESKE